MTFPAKSMGPDAEVTGRHLLDDRLILVSTAELNGMVFSIYFISYDASNRYLDCWSQKKKNDCDYTSPMEGFKL